MIAVDTNVLVFAHRQDSLFHAAAEAAMRQLAEGRAPWALRIASSAGTHS